MSDMGDLDDSNNFHLTVKVKVGWIPNPRMPFENELEVLWLPFWI